jgi:GrpB-like predicted nucleotidyltransferase (UPF0157 family)
MHRREVSNARQLVAAVAEAPAQEHVGADDSPITIVEYDASWPAFYTAERERLRGLLPELHISHIGSTAVPSLAAKPIIDMIALVDDLDSSAGRVIERAGYFMPARFNKGLEHRRYLCYPSESFRSHHLHLVDEPNDLEMCVRFRDLLRADAQLAEQYATLKRLLAAQFQSDRESYTKAKTGFIHEAEMRLSPEEGRRASEGNGSVSDQNGRASAGRRA